MGRFLRRQARALAFGPADLRVTRNQRRIGNVIVVLDPEHVRFARDKQNQRFGRRRPSGKPTHAGPDALLPAHQQRVARVSLHNRGQRASPAYELRIGKAPVRGGQNGCNLWIVEDLAGHSLGSRPQAMASAPIQRSRKSPSQRRIAGS